MHYKAIHAIHTIHAIQTIHTITYQYTQYIQYMQYMQYIPIYTNTCNTSWYELFTNTDTIQTNTCEYKQIRHIIQTNTDEYRQYKPIQAYYQYVHNTYQYMSIQINTYTIHTNTIIHTQYKKRPKYKPIQANVRIVYVLEGQYKHEISIQTNTNMKVLWWSNWPRPVCRRGARCAWASRGPAGRPLGFRIAVGPEPGARRWGEKLGVGEVAAKLAWRVDSEMLESRCK